MCSVLSKWLETPKYIIPKLLLKYFTEPWIWFVNKWQVFTYFLEIQISQWATWKEERHELLSLPHTSTFISFCQVLPLFFQGHGVLQIFWGCIQQLPLFTCIKYTPTVFIISFSQRGHGIPVKNTAEKVAKISLLRTHFRKWFFKTIIVVKTMQMINKPRDITKTK